MRSLGNRKLEAAGIQEAEEKAGAADGLHGHSAPAFGRAAQHLPAMPSPAKIKAKERYQRAAKTAASLLPGLPDQGESVHALMIGTFDLCQVIVPSVNRLPACLHLRIATLCFSKRNAVELIGLLESHPDLRLSLLRTNGNREQLAVIRDRTLHDWHATWIDELVNSDEGNEDRHQSTN